MMKNLEINGVFCLFKVLGIHSLAHSTHYYLIIAIFFIGIPIGSLCGGERFMFMGKNYIHVEIF